MSEAKKFVKHTPRETPKAKRKLTAKAPKQQKPPIPQDTLEALKLRFSVPVSKKTDEIEESDLEMWQLVCDLKGWLSRDATELKWKEFAWGKLREILDQAVAKGDQKPFEQFSKAWQKADIRKSARRKIKPKDPKNRTKHRLELAEKIEALLPNIPANKPNSPISIVILDIIASLQPKLKTRAPTIDEILAQSVKLKGMEEKGGINRREAVRQIEKMGISLSLDDR
jgi:hypothetical protein